METLQENSITQFGCHQNYTRRNLENGLKNSKIRGGPETIQWQKGWKVLNGDGQTRNTQDINLQDMPKRGVRGRGV